MNLSVIDEIEQERQRQIDQKGKRPSVDATDHVYKTLSNEAARILLGQPQVLCKDKRHLPFRDRMIIAAALIVAEIERYDFMVAEGIDADIRGEVELNFAFSWICPECGHGNFCLPRETTQEQLLTRMGKMAVPKMELEASSEGTVMEIPTSVICSSCHVSQETTFKPTPEMPDAEDD